MLTSAYIKDIIYLVILRVSIASKGLDRLRFLRKLDFRPII